jgi:fido (protein-threonine AMPylation protein)
MQSLTAPSASTRSCPITSSEIFTVKLYGDFWTWAGRFRTRELNIGIAPEQIVAALRTSLGNARYRW